MISIPPGRPAARATMGNDLAAWLGAVKCGALLAPLKNQYGIDKVEELLDLDPEDVDALCALVMKSPSKQFRRALEALPPRDHHTQPAAALPAGPPCSDPGAAVLRCDDGQLSFTHAKRLLLDATLRPTGRPDNIMAPDDEPPAGAAAGAHGSVWKCDGSKRRRKGTDKWKRPGGSKSFRLSPDGDIRKSYGHVILEPGKQRLPCQVFEMGRVGQGGDWQARDKLKLYHILSKKLPHKGRATPAPQLTMAKRGTQRSPAHSQGSKGQRVRAPSVHTLLVEAYYRSQPAGSFLLPEPRSPSPSCLQPHLRPPRPRSCTRGLSPITAQPLLLCHHRPARRSTRDCRFR